MPATVADRGHDASRRCRSPRIPAIDKTFNIIVTGVGGTGVVTIGAILGMAAHLEGKGLRHDRHGRPRPEGRRRLQPCAPRERARTTSTPSASPPARPTSCSAATSSSPAPRRCWPRCRPGRTALVVNTAEVMPGDFTRNADFSLPAERIKRAITAAAGAERRRLRRRDRDRDGAPRQCHRGEHVHARLRLSARPRAALGAPPSSRRSSSTARR